MLAALLEGEREHYSVEGNVVQPGLYASELFKGIDQQYAFVGGPDEQYVAHPNRRDVDPDFWGFQDLSAVKADAGSPCVPKKGGRQRKLLMQCPSNMV